MQLKIPVSDPFEENIILMGLPNKKFKIKGGTIINETDLIEDYTNGIITLKRSSSSNEEFILLNPKDNISYATFKKSTKKDIYRVQLSDGTFTLGYVENGKIIIEVLEADSSLRTEIFEKK